MKGKKGLSTVVTTLIIILLVLVAVGIIWGVVNNLLGKSTGTIEMSTKCLDVDVRATKVVLENATASNDTYFVTLYRSPTGDDEVGAKIVFFSATENSAPIDFGSMFIPMKTATEDLNATITDVTSVTVTPYFLNADTGKETLCPTTTTFEFT